MSALYAVVAALLASVLLILRVEQRLRRIRRREPAAKPPFHMLRNGRVRFHLEDLRNSVVEESRPAGDPPYPHSQVETTLPDVFAARDRRRYPSGRTTSGPVWKQRIC